MENGGPTTRESLHGCEPVSACRSYRMDVSRCHPISATERQYRSRNVEPEHTIHLATGNRGQDRMAHRNIHCPEAREAFFDQSEVSHDLKDK